MNKKQAFQQIRHLAKRGSNEMLERKVNEIFQAGFEAGMAALSEELKGRINVDQQETTGLEKPQTTEDSIDGEA